MADEKKVERKVDRRVIKTKRAICNAFALLLSKKDFNDITIKEIADVADVNRKTVYNYYNGIHEILSDIEDQVVSSYVNAIRMYNFTEEIRNPYNLFINLTNILNNNIELYGSLMSINKNSNLLSKIITSVKEKVIEELKGHDVLLDDKIEFVVSYSISGMVAAYQTWYNSNSDQSLMEFSKDVGKIVLLGANSFLNRK